MPYVKIERRIYLDPIVDDMVRAKLSMNDITEFLEALAGVWVRCDYIPNYQTILDMIDLGGIHPDGDINYILFKYAKYHIKPSYNNYKDYIGAIEDAIDHTIGHVYASEYRHEYREVVAEIRRRLLAKYEDEKIEENGDV